MSDIETITQPEYRARIEPQISSLIRSKCSDIGFQNEMLAEMMDCLSFELIAEIEDILCGAMPFGAKGGGE